MGDQNFFLTGSLDQHVRVWNGQGGCDFAQKCGGQVLALCTTQDPSNKAVVLVGLAGSAGPSGSAQDERTDELELNRNDSE